MTNEAENNKQLVHDLSQVIIDIYHLIVKVENQALTKTVQEYLKNKGFNVVEIKGTVQ